MKKFLFSIVALLPFATTPIIAMENYSFDASNVNVKHEQSQIVVIQNDAILYDVQKYGVNPYYDVGIRKSSVNNYYIAKSSQKSISPDPAYNVQLHIDPGRCGLVKSEIIYSSKISV